jgi:hypothetical protein
MTDGDEHQLLGAGDAPTLGQLTREQLKTKAGTIITPKPFVHDSFQIPDGRS